MGSASTTTTYTLEPLVLAALSSQPLVSILLANYNYAHFISQSIDSVLAQTYKHWELVVCDDGSTDSSVSLIQKYVAADSRITLACQPNGGHTSALNSAFSRCRGEIICFLDSDDLFLPAKLRQVVESCASNPSAGIVIHRVIRVDQTRSRKGVWPLSDLPDGWLGRDLLSAGGVFPYAPPTSGISLRRQLAELIFPISMQPPLHMCPDQVVMRLAPLVSSVKRIPAALAEFRMHSANTYSQQEVSAPAVAKQLQLSVALWQEQRRFLGKIDTDLSEQLASLDSNPFTAMLQYLEVKLSGGSAVRPAYRKFSDARKRSGESKFNTFWKLSLYLPNFIFRPAVGLLFGQGALKQFIARLKRLA